MRTQKEKVQEIKTLMQNSGLQQNEINQVLLASILEIGSFDSEAELKEAIRVLELKFQEQSQKLEAKVA